VEKTPIDYSKLSPELQEKIKKWEAKKPENQQLQVLSDIAMMVQELINVADDTKKESKDSLKALGAVLTDAREQLITLNKKEAPESPDYAKPVVEAVNKLRAALQESIDKIDVKPQVNVKVPKIDAPVVNVDSPSVSVDLKGVEKIIKNDIPKAFKEAIAQIPETVIPEAPDRWDEVLEWLKSIDTASRLKPVMPNQMVVVNPDGTEIGSSSAGMAIENAISSLAFDLDAAAYSGTSNQATDYILDSIEFNFSTAESKTVTVTSPYGTVIYESTGTDQDIVVSDINMGFEGGANFSIDVTTTAAACLMDVVAKVRRGETPLVGDSTITGDVGSRWYVSNISPSTDPEIATYKYYGFEDKDGNWYIQRKTVATNAYLFASGTSGYSTAWTNKDSQTYASAATTFN